MRAFLAEFGVAIGLLVLLITAWQVGRRLGKIVRGDLATHPQLGNVQGAVMGILALLLGFCFAGAVSRFVDRQDILVREASAISTLNDMAMILDEPASRELRGMVREYALERVRLLELSGLEDEAPLLNRLAALQDRMWALIVPVTRTSPQYAGVLLTTTNALSDTLAERNAADSRHTPMLVLLVVLICSFASVASVSIGVEAADERLRIPAMIVVLLIGLLLWVIIDLDLPRVGLIKIHPQPMLDVVARLTAPN